MKKHWLFTTILALALCAICCTLFSTEAKAEKPENHLGYDVVDGEAIITNCDESVAGSIIVPETLYGYPVTAIGYRAFYYCTKITDVDIADGVTSIGELAFENCSELKEINIPGSVTKIDNLAFWMCCNLQSIHMHSTAVEGLDIGENAFDGVDNEKCILYVPAGTKEAYSNHPVLGKFKKIEEE